MRGRREVRGRPQPVAGGIPVAAYPVRVPVVALVASTGGLDALSRVLGPLPADLPAAVLVAQHLDP
ncbi:chemotaxis protein CheB, partial [Amycolatopsis sp. SID8362]|uniref:chemotaxis protein CheB n=1 Tax=Amycolatopsis sp. SID8362 TaxID=2690346 RepID=UPI001371CA01